MGSRRGILRRLGTVNPVLISKNSEKMPKSAKKFIFENPIMTKWFIPIFFLRMFFFMGNIKMVSKF